MGQNESSINGADGLKELKELEAKLDKEQNGSDEVKTEPKKKDLGKIEMKPENDLLKGPANFSVGYRIIPIPSFPSKGKYYPSDFEVSARALTTEEIKHYSTMDENDLFDIEKHINGVIDKACRIKMNGGMGSYNDLKESDKLYVLFTIRDMTMDRHQRQIKLQMPSTCNSCGKTEKIHIEGDVFSYYEIDRKLMEYFIDNSRAFELGTDIIGENVKFFVPSIGVAESISSYIQEKERKKKMGENGYYNKNFLTALQFLVEDWRVMNTAFIDKMQKQYDSEWSVDKIQFIDVVIEKINLKIKPSITRVCDRDNQGCGAEVTTPIRFPNGYRSIFHLSNFSERLFGDSE